VRAGNFNSYPMATPVLQLELPMNQANLELAETAD